MSATPKVSYLIREQDVGAHLDVPVHGVQHARRLTTAHHLRKPIEHLLLGPLEHPGQLGRVGGVAGHHAAVGSELLRDSLHSPRHRRVHRLGASSDRIEGAAQTIREQFPEEISQRDVSLRRPAPVWRALTVAVHRVHVNFQVGDGTGRSVVHRDGP